MTINQPVNTFYPHSKGLKGIASLVIITFKKPDFICKVGYEYRDVPRKAGFRWVNEYKHWCTQSPVVAARLRQYADKSAKIQINRILLSCEPWAGRISYPKNFNPMPFQLEGVRFALSRNRSYLAFDPGLGKTATAAMIALTYKPLHVVYVCPPFLKQTVEYEFEKLDAPLSLVVGDSMIHRDAIQKEIVRLTKKGNTLLIVDEAHRFKTETSRRTKALFGYTDPEKKKKNYDGITPFFSRVVFLSGTPIPNRPIELFPLLNNCAPETIDFKNKFEFGRRYCAGHKTQFGWDFKGASNMLELAQKVKGAFMLRRRKSEVLKELPPKTEELVLIGENLSPTLASVDRSILKSFSPEDLMGHLAPNDHVSTYRKELGKLKSPKAAAFVKEILDESNESILVFAIHKDVVARLAKDLSEYNPLIITGDVPTQKRNQIVTLFQNDTTRRVLIGNVDACGLGFTLTKATRVVFAEFSWVPAINDQASDRAHRIGQKDNVLVQYLVFKNSIDRTVIETILRKRNVIKHI